MSKITCGLFLKIVGCVLYNILLIKNILFEKNVDFYKKADK